MVDFTSMDYGERVDLGEIPTQPPCRLAITVATEDGSLLPDKSVVYVGRREAWRGSEFVLPGQPSTEVVIEDASAEAFQIVLRIPGYRVVEAQPLLNVDINGGYIVDVRDRTQVRFMLRKEGAQPAARLKT